MNNTLNYCNKLFITFVITIISFGISAESSEHLEIYKKLALNSAKEYEGDVRQIANTVKNNYINKEQFLTKQRELLNLAYQKQDKTKENINKLIVFLSFSMPKEAIKELLIQSAQYNAVLVIQGLVDNSFPKTINAISDVIKRAGQKGGITIEPNIFEQYKINSVPAFVLNHENKIDSDSDVVYGASGIRHALEIIANSDVKSKDIARRIIKNA